MPLAAGNCSTNVDFGGKPKLGLHLQPKQKQQQLNHRHNIVYIRPRSALCLPCSADRSESQQLHHQKTATIGPERQTT
ncbi:phospholipase A2, group X-like protein [Anopheles sinensis]|uniref:Phospholipase A2, group X-like protein n=1 Tax=Anopheles sinensis TaxID=74873 RepID=A0A084VCE1_ANOSI|nr:phospholipase A2, group X-like protein [Anopheles sinensis]